MSELREGVAVVVNGLEVDGDRVAISAGTAAASEVGLDAFYVPGARLPAEPFRSPSARELSLLLAAPGQDLDWARTVLLTRVPSELLDLLCPLKLDTRRDIATACAVYRSERFDAILESFVAAIVDRYARRTERVHSLGLTFHPPGLPTVSSDASNASRHPYILKRLGLHVDDALLAPLSVRDLSPNRIAINVGSEDRHLLFINLPLRELANMLAPTVGPFLERPDQAVVMFMRAFPDYPVIRVLIRPGEAYVAPTDNLIHDGATTTAVAPSASVHILGDFGLPGASSRLPR
jgi:hypothetical protein